MITTPTKRPIVRAVRYTLSVYPTLREVLELPVLAAGSPIVRAAASGIGVPVHSVHVSELRNVAGTLTGNVLVLSVGLPMTEPGFDAPAYVRSLRDAGAIGLVVELGQHLTSLPDALVQAARATGFPLVELRRMVRFLEVTQTIHARIVNGNYERLRLAEHAHEAFGIGATPATTDAVLTRAAELTGLPVVLEDLAHRALAFAGGGSTESVLRDWTARSRLVPARPHTTWGGPERWMCTPVGPPMQRWGRLVVPVRCDTQLGLTIVLERAAEALTITRLVERDALAVELEAQSGLLYDLLHGAVTGEGSLQARAKALGLHTAAFYAALVCHAAGPDRAVLEATVAACRTAGKAGVAGVLAPGRIGVALPCSSQDEERTLLQRVADAVPAHLVKAFGAGTPVRRLSELPTSFSEAIHAAEVAGEAPLVDQARVHRVGDLGARGLLWWLREHPRLHEFTEDQLRPLLTLPEAQREAGLATLRVFVRTGSTMTAFAKAMNLSRPAAYSRIRTIERILDIDISNPDTRLSAPGRAGSRPTGPIFAIAQHRVRRAC